MSQEIELYLFDLGGVVIELAGNPLPGSQMKAAEWLSSSIAKDFERGYISQQEFAAKFRKRLGIEASTEDIIAYFKSWPRGFYPGAIDFLTIAEKYQGSRKEYKSYATERRFAQVSGL